MTNITEFKDPSFVEPSILAPKPKLYSKLWNKKTNKLHPDLSIKLKQIARDFISGFVHPLRIKDIILTGSLANFNWNKFSDIDLHVVVDFNDVPEEHYDAFLDYFDAKKRLWNSKHNIMIANHEVEIYIQDFSEPHHSTGIYSVMNDRWLREPAYEKQELDYENIINKAEFFSSAINDIVQLFIDEQYNDVIQKSELLQNKLKKFRQAGLEQKGEYSTENLVFKTLRNNGYLDKLSNVRSKAYDKKMSVEEELSIFATQQTLEEVKKIKKKKKKKRDSCYYKAKAKYKVWPCVPEDSSKALTRKGWKKVDDLSIGEEIMTYSIEKDILEFKPIKNIHRFKNAPTKVIRSGNTGFMFESTDNHKWAIRLPKIKNNIRIKYQTNNDVCLLETDALMRNKNNKYLIVSSIFDEKNNGIRKEKFYKYGDNWLEYIINCSFEQRQAWLFSAIVYDGNQKKIERLTFNDNNIGILEWEYDNKEGRQAFAFKQKDLIHRDAFLLSAFLNGGIVSYKKAKNKEIYNCHYTSNKTEKNTSNFKVINEHVKDVWCPETENGTWVMNQEVGDNGIITITGNSAYASGYLVRCRKKKGKIKEELDEEIELDEESLENLLDEEIELDEEILETLSEEELDEKKKKSNFSKERDQGLRGWFSRVGEEGKSKGWVDCNTCRKDPDSGRKKCKSCGRKKGEKRRKYPACRPTPSQCTRSGMKRKKSSKAVSWKSKKDK